MRHFSVSSTVDFELHEKKMEMETWIFYGLKSNFFSKKNFE